MAVDAPAFDAAAEPDAIHLQPPAREGQVSPGQLAQEGQPLAGHRPGGPGNAALVREPGAAEHRKPAPVHRWRRDRTLRAAARAAANPGGTEHVAGGPVQRASDPWTCHGALAAARRCHADVARSGRAVTARLGPGVAIHVAGSIGDPSLVPDCRAHAGQSIRHPEPLACRRLDCLVLRLSLERAFFRRPRRDAALAAGRSGADAGRYGLAHVIAALKTAQSAGADL